MCVILIKLVMALCRINKEWTKKTSSFSLFFSSPLLPITKQGPHKYLYDYCPENLVAKLLFSKKIVAHILHVSKEKSISFLPFPKTTRTFWDHLLEPTVQLVLPKACCPGLRPAGFWISSQKKTPQPLRVNSAGIWPSSQFKNIFMFRRNLMFLKFVPIVICFVSGQQ